MATATDARLFGKSIKRKEDPRFITGRGRYTDDLKLAGMTYAAFVRSPHARARVRKIDVSAAKARPGVVAIFTGKDMTGVNSLPFGWLLPELKIPPHPLLASDRSSSTTTRKTSARRRRGRTSGPSGGRLPGARRSRPTTTAATTSPRPS